MAELAYPIYTQKSELSYQNCSNAVENHCKLNQSSFVRRTSRLLEELDGQIYLRHVRTHLASHILHDQAGAWVWKHCLLREPFSIKMQTKWNLTYINLHRFHFATISKSKKRTSRLATPWTDLIEAHQHHSWHRGLIAIPIWKDNDLRKHMSWRKFKAATST